MAMDNTAAKVAKLREMAKDKNLPQDVRNTYLDEAVKLEEKAAMKSGVRMAKGGMPMVEKAGVKVPAFAADGVGKMAKGGAVVAKAPTKDLPMRGSRTATNMAKGGSAMKKAKK
jgi:hypothetical protein